MTTSVVIIVILNLLFGGGPVPIDGEDPEVVTPYGPLRDAPPPEGELGSFAWGG